MRILLKKQGLCYVFSSDSYHHDVIFLPQVKAFVTQSCPTHCNSVDCSPPDCHKAQRDFQSIRKLENIFYMCVCIYVHVYVLVTQSCLTICDTMGCSLPGSSLHGILQVRRLEWVAILFSRGSFPTQESNLCLLHCKNILYHLSHKGRLYIYIHIYTYIHTQNLQAYYFM